MQEVGTIPHWMQLALTALASILSGIGIDKVYNTWLNRKKPAAEIQVTQATATEITLRSSSAAGDAVIRMMTRLDQAQVTIDRLRDERDEWEMKAFDLQMDLRDSRDVNAQLMEQAKLDNYQLKKQMAFIEMRNLKDQYITLDQPKDDPRRKDEH